MNEQLFSDIAIYLLNYLVLEKRSGVHVDQCRSLSHPLQITMQSDKNIPSFFSGTPVTISLTKNPNFFLWIKFGFRARTYLHDQVKISHCKLL